MTTTPTFASPVEFLNGTLMQIERPGRYIGGEMNSVVKSWEGKTSLLLFFPDVYEIGMSNLGLKILYEVVNEQPDFLAERAFSPWPDFEKKLIEHSLLLFSLESKKPVKDFDVVGFSLQFELTFTNVLNGLKLAGIPILSHQRAEDSPIIIAGGPATANPEPMADFIDAFLIGEGEEATLEMLAVIRSGKDKQQSREDILRSLCSVPGVYVPRFYESFEERGVFQRRPLSPDLPAVIKKRLFAGFAESRYPVKPLLPNTPATHDRGMVELFRGCMHHCRFCQAVQYYSRVRIRSLENILGTIEDQMKSAGYYDFGLCSLSTTDYPYLSQLIKGISAKYPAVGISLPSLRVDQSLKFLEESDSRLLAELSQQNMTIAPECGSDALRRSLGKRLTNSEVVQMVESAFARKVEGIKLYFMVGLPGETDHHIDELIELGKELSDVAYSSGRRKKLRLSVNPFIPKCHTPYQWYGMMDPEVILDREKRIAHVLRGRSNISINYRDPSLSLLEGALSKGDRRLGQLILRQFEKGFSFDAWGSFNRDRLNDWRGEAEAMGFSLDAIARDDHDVGLPLPWEHIALFSECGKLLQEKEKAISELS